MIINKQNVLMVGLVSSLTLISSVGADSSLQNNKIDASKDEIDALTNDLAKLEVTKKEEIKPFAEMLGYMQKGFKDKLEVFIKEVVTAEGKSYTDKSGSGSNSGMGLFNNVLVMHPVGIVRVEYAYDATLKVFKVLPHLANTPEEVAKKMTFLLAPVKQFFSEIRAYAGMILPLVKDSFCKMHTTGIDEKNSILISFLTGDEKDAGVFFGKHVTTLQQLAQVSYEFIVFFKDLKTSFSPEARRAGHEFMERIERSKQAAAANARG